MGFLYTIELILFTSKKGILSEYSLDGGVHNSMLLT